LISSASGAELTSSQTVKISNQKLEFADLHLRIKNAGITKIHIVNLKKGTLRNTMGIDSSKLLVWNGAGRRLFSTMTDAHSSGFVVWEFNPGSLAEKELDEQLKLAGKRYSDDLLYIMWDGLEFQVD
jgi:hypothetical protein